MKADLLQKIKQEKLIAIVRGISKEECLRAAEALCAGGFHLMEIAFNQKDPASWRDTAETIRAVSAQFAGEMEVGAGTVTSEHLVELAADAGAKYMISPDTNLAVIRRTQQMGLISMPGALTPSEILTAYEAGADFVKLFPIANLGPDYVKAVRAPISHVPMLAVGGVNENNLKAYLDLGIAGAGIGGNLVNKKWVADGEYHKITEVAKMLTAIAQA